MASQNRFKRYRQALRSEYRNSICEWIDREPHPLRLIAHLRWKRSKPIPPKCYKKHD